MADNLLAEAYRILARRAYTRAEMAKKLEGKAPAEEVEEVLNNLAQAGYLDDRAFVREYIQQRLSLRPSGRRLLEMKLRAKGVAPVVIKEVLDDALNPQDEEEAAKVLAEKKSASLKGLDEAARQRRIYQFLLSRGFSPQVAGKYARFSD
ncbi:MAG: regulatory protein RecX [Candidatus Omnitrophota bacterium]